MAVEWLACVSCEVMHPVTLLKEDKCGKCRGPYIPPEPPPTPPDDAPPVLPAFMKAPEVIQQERTAEAARRARENERRESAAAEKAATDKKAAVVKEFDAKLEASKILARREMCRRHYLPFVMEMVPGYQPGWVHKDLCQRLEKFSDDVANQRSPRLMIFMPPRHGKSESGTKTFPTWHLGKYPEHEFIVTSYAAALAESFSRRNRSIMKSPEYQAIFKTRLDPDTQSVQNWMTTESGGLLAAGVGGPITGRGSHVLMIDDPVKNKEEAESETVRAAVKDWYTSTAYTRLAPGGGVLVIMTRWHADDLAGWLLALREAGEGDDWEVVNYPAVATDDEPYRRKGEALHPERYDLTALGRIKRAVGTQVWEALYQQNPTAADGVYFTTQMFRFYKVGELPPREELTFFTAWDLAIGQKQYNDYSVGITVGADRAGNLWLVDLVRGRWQSMELVDQILDMQMRWNAAETGIEKGQIEMTIAPFLRQRVRERKQYGFFVRELKVGRSDKVARARSIQGRMQQGMVMFPQNAPWMQTFVNELLQFDKGVHDDQVDALAWIGNMLDRYYGKTQPVEQKKSWRDKLRLKVGGDESSAMSA